MAVGAQSAAERNTALRNAAEDHRTKLLEGGEHLAQLAHEIELGAEEARALASMSAKIQSFVGQAQTIAKRTNMLALNAAIEAARASGAETRGFRRRGRRGAQTRRPGRAQAATTTSETVHQVLSTVGATRERLDRLAAGSASVREVAESAARGLQEVADAAAESSAWTDEISNAAGEVRHLVEEITERLRVMSDGTSSFVESVEGIAASSQQQSASTEEIAQSAGQLAGAAEKLTAAIANFRLNERDQ